MIVKLLLIFVGGGIGAVCRYGVAGLLQNGQVVDPPGFPVGTLVVNLVGCLLIGLAAGWLAGGVILTGDDATKPEWMRLFLMVGLLGGFTTFSTFGLESIELLQHKRWLALVIYVGVSNIGGLALAWVGLKVTG